MDDLGDALVELRYLGLPDLPEAGDAGDLRLARALEREMDHTPSRWRRWMKRRVRIAGLAVPSFVLLAVVATAAAATAAAIVTATDVFRNDPQGLDVNGQIEKVLPSTVRKLSTVTIPDYGQVAVWGARTKPGGFCFALRLPDGDWGGLHTSQNTQDGWDGGSLPGCFQTRQQQILLEPPLKPGQKPNGTTGQVLMPTPVEAWYNAIKNHAGQLFTLYIGYVEVQGTATTVRDPDTGAITKVKPGGYYILSEPTHSTAPLGADGGELQALNAAGHPLQADYTWGKMLAGHQQGPSQH